MSNTTNLRQAPGAQDFQQGGYAGMIIEDRQARPTFMPAADQEADPPRRAMLVSELERQRWRAPALIYAALQGRRNVVMGDLTTPEEASERAASDLAGLIRAGLPCRLGCLSGRGERWRPLALELGLPLFEIDPLQGFERDEETLLELAALLPWHVSGPDPFPMAQAARERLIIDELARARSLQELQGQLQSRLDDASRAELDEHREPGWAINALRDLNHGLLEHIGAHARQAPGRWEDPGTTWICCQEPEELALLRFSLTQELRRPQPGLAVFATLASWPLPDPEDDVWALSSSGASLHFEAAPGDVEDQELWERTRHSFAVELRGAQPGWGELQHLAGDPQRVWLPHLDEPYLPGDPEVANPLWQALQEAGN